ncbi:MAG: porin [Rhodocyclaceae bacterium]|nr:MAG: porin [Rhodocyclaceae bacterium]
MKSRRHPSLKPSLLNSAVALACFSAFGAHAGGTISFGEDKSVSIGLGMRASYSSVENGAPNGTSRSSDFNLDSIRLYTSASLNKIVKGTFNTEKTADNSVQVLDAIARFEFSDGFNVWMGRMLPPSDRANLDGPYYLNTWSYPMVSQYPAKFAGRDDGLTVWGKLPDKKFVYSAGMFQGHNKIAGASNDSGSLLYAGRLQYNFWDAEPNPAYYTSSTYYGGAEVLALGLSAQYQKDGVGTNLLKGDYKAWSLDALMEKKVGIGVLTLEGAYYKYDTNNVTDVAAGFGGAGVTANVGGITQGKAHLLGAAYLFPDTVGWGKFQPVLRYQKFDADLTSVISKQTDLGLNYIIDGHNARISATYSKNQVTSAADVNRIIIGTQLQF